MTTGRTAASVPPMAVLWTVVIVAALGSMRPVLIVLATAVPNSAPIKFQNAAQMTATRGVNTFVETTVAMAFADDAQVIDRSVNTFPEASFNSACNTRVSPIRTSRSAGETDTVATGTTTTGTTGSPPPHAASPAKRQTVIQRVFPAVEEYQNRLSRIGKGAKVGMHCSPNRHSRAPLRQIHFHGAHC